MTLWGRLASTLIEPAPSAAVSGASVGSSHAVVCCASDIAVAASVAAAGATERAGGAPALVFWWAEDESSGVGGSRFKRLPNAPDQHEAAIELACAEAGPGPLVLVAAGARPAAVDEMLRRADSLLVAVPAPGDPIAELVWQRVRAPHQGGGVLHLPVGIDAAACARGLVSRRRARAAAALLGGPEQGDRATQGPRHALA